MDEHDRNKAVVRRFVIEIFQELRPESVDELAADDFVWHRPTGQPGDKQFLRESTTRMAGALKDLQFTIHDEIAEGDRVAIRLTASGTAAADFPGIAGAAGHSYSIEEIHIFRLRDGQVVEHWHQYDALGQQRQLRGEGGP
jgi:steroid delta-isomerase-like uncharacterized protein